MGAPQGLKQGPFIAQAIQAAVNPSSAQARRFRAAIARLRQGG